MWSITAVTNTTGTNVDYYRGGYTYYVPAPYTVSEPVVLATWPWVVPKIVPKEEEKEPKSNRDRFLKLIKDGKL